MIYKPLISRTLLILVLFLGTQAVFAQDETQAESEPIPEQNVQPDQALSGDDLDLAAGRTLYNTNCATCHSKDMRSPGTGPALGGVQERWAGYGPNELYDWIRNSQAMIAKGHPRAVELWNEWKPTIMNSFTGLTNAEINNILGYIDGVYEGTYPPRTDGGVGPAAVQAVETDNTALYILLTVILGILALVLARIVANLRYMIQVREGTAPAQRQTLVQILTSKAVIAFVIFSLVVLGGYTTVNNAIMLGRQQGYQPEQPIWFSHELHAGVQQIDCQYCHDGARRSKHSVIPAANTCMNCHRAIKEGRFYGTAEIGKIFASIGYDPINDTYIENYEEMSTEEIKALYSRWIADTYTKSEDFKAEKIEEVVEEQWAGIVKALTNRETGDDRIQGPIEWVRIHNLPDHAYFNHAQHVSIGQVACQTCHGPVEEMEEVYQYSPLSMGWCINCHRETDVQFESNDYYKTYELYHEQLQSGERERVTVEDLGGTECQKCHY